MVHDLAKKITNILIQNGVAIPENENQYIYGLEVTLEKTITYTVLIILSIYLKLLIPSILFIIFFITLRGSTGGYHASTFFKCFVSTIFMYLSCSMVLVPFFIKEKVYIYFILLIASIIIILLAPMNHPNLDMDSDEIKRCKRDARIILLLELTYFEIGGYLGINPIYIIFPIIGVIMCAILLAIAKIMKQEVKKDERQHG